MSDLDARLAAMSHWGNEGVCLLVLETGVRTLRGNRTDTYKRISYIDFRSDMVEIEKAETRKDNSARCDRGS
ncbi:Uncharacterized protein HZ326_14875 [Fusarium oxysporum f. sp. albedinis]|nr:Uncharacterized protein HZ326_14875 [Fusarium oxysporum f. sp. albedinis]